MARSAKRNDLVGPPFSTRTQNGETEMVIKNAKTIAAAAALVSALALSACGTTPGDRAVSGGLLGAGAGAAVGSLAGNAGAGAVIGGLGGAAVGAATDPCTLNLGDPFWRDHGGEAEYNRRCRR
jgi:hypothetical protein